jgi:NifU-like protein involved in Fe-S cluster formation
MAKYPKYLMEHFQNPKNVGEISNPDGVGTVGNASCGDIMQIFIKVNGNRISEEILSQIPKEKIACFTLSTHALKLAIEEYKCKQVGLHREEELDSPPEER